MSKPGIGHVHIVEAPPGQPGSTGPRGLPGPRGAAILSGTGAPTSQVGEDGDFFLRTDTQPRRLYGPRTNGSWTSAYQELLTDLTPGMKAAADSAAASAALVTTKAADVQTAATATTLSKAAAQAAASQAATDRAVAADHADQTAADKAQTTYDRLQVEHARDLANQSATISRITLGETRQLAATIAVPLFDWSWDSDPSPDNDWSNT